MKFGGGRGEELKVSSPDIIGTPDLLGTRFVENEGSREGTRSSVRDTQDLGEHGELGLPIGAATDPFGEIKNQIYFTLEFFEVVVDILMDFEIGESVTMTFDSFTYSFDGFPFIAFDLFFKSGIESIKITGSFVVSESDVHIVIIT